MSQGGLVDVGQSNPKIPTVFETDDEDAVASSNIIQILGGEGIETSGVDNIITVSGKLSTAGVDVGSTTIGVCSFDSENFQVTDGFVELVGGGFGVVSLLSDEGSPAVVPDGSGQVQILATSGITTTGQGPSNILTIEGVKSTAGATGGSSTVGVCSFDSTNFSVANGFVTLNGAGFSWSEETTTGPIDIDNNHGYIANNASAVIFTLPLSANIGDTFQVVGKGAGGWQIQQNASQVVHFLSQDTPTGVAGALTSTGQYDGIEILCITQDTDFLVIDSVGNISIDTIA